MKSMFRPGLGLLVAFLLPACGGPTEFPLLTFTPSALSFVGSAGGPNPSNQTLTMKAADMLWLGHATWTATTDETWLTVTPTSGTILPGQKVPLTTHVNLLTAGWQGPTSTVGAPFVDDNTIAGWAAWTGSAMLIWGGDPAVPAKSYDPVSDTWSGSTSTVNAPSKRNGYTAVWTGTEMIIWGGYSMTPFAAMNTGARYNTATDTWTPTSTVGAPSARTAHRAVWTGSRMIVWGGDQLGFSYVNTGGIYDPATDTWTSTTSTVNAPAPRGSHAAAWTGTEMIVWGGENPSKFNDGKFYNPTTDTWSGSITTTGAPSARSHLQGIWTGQEFVVWGGGPTTFSNVYANDGARYNPATDIWTALLQPGAPEARSSHNVLWTGSEMIVWGGVNAATNINTGAIYRVEAAAAGTTTAHIRVICRNGPARIEYDIPVQVTVNP